jgi:hypothetical protein
MPLVSEPRGQPLWWSEAQPNGETTAVRGAGDPMSATMGGPFEMWFENLLRKVVREELAAAGHPADDWRDQRGSPLLGPRRHCAAVRRRLDADPHDPMAKIVGDRFLLTTDAIAEELERIGRKPSPVAKCSTVAPAESPEAEATERVKRRLRGVK